MTLMSLIATNFLGQNTPAIFAIELEYIEMWAQDVAAMFGYHAGAASVAAALPSITSAPSSLAGLFTTPLTSLASSAGSIFGPGLSSFVGAAQTAVAEMSSLFSVPAVSSLTTVAQIGMYPASAVVPPMMVLAHGGTPASAAVGATEVLAGAQGFVGSTAPATQALGSTGGWGSAMSAGLGSARFVGAISVPPTWQGAAPARIITAAMSGLEGAAPGVSGATGPTGVPVVPPNGTAPGAPGAGNGRGNPRATHVVQSRPRVVPRTAWCHGPRSDNRAISLPEPNPAPGQGDTSRRRVMWCAQLVGTGRTQAPAQWPDIPAYLFRPGDRSYRFVNFDSHGYEFRCRADRKSDSTLVFSTRAGPVDGHFRRRSSHRTGSPRTGLARHDRSVCMNCGTVCPTTSSAAHAGRREILKGTEANLSARHVGSGATVVSGPAIRAQSAALFNTRKIGYSRILTLCLTYDYEGLGGD
jgi:hypothetical protein